MGFRHRYLIDLDSVRDCVKCKKKSTSLETSLRMPVTMVMGSMLIYIATFTLHLQVQTS